MHRTQRPSNVEIRADDPALTGHAGLLLTGELAARTDLVARLDRAIDAVRPFKQRRRGSSAGELLVALAEMIAVGGDHLVHLDELREDEASAELRAVGEALAPTTAGQLMRRLNARQCQAAVAELAKVGEEVDRQLGLTAMAPVTLDLDSSDTEVYGRDKEGAAFNHRGQRSYDSQLATWAERRRVLAAELRSGNLTEHPTAVKVLRRALTALPAAHGRVRARMDSGFASVAIEVGEDERVAVHELDVALQRELELGLGHRPPVPAAHTSLSSSTGIRTRRTIRRSGSCGQPPGV